MNTSNIILLAIVIGVILLDMIIRRQKSDVVVRTSGSRTYVLLMTLLIIILTPILIFALEYVTNPTDPIEFYASQKLEYSKLWIALYALIGGFISAILFRKTETYKSLFEEIKNKPKRIFLAFCSVLISKVLIHYSLFPRIAGSYLSVAEVNEIRAIERELGLTRGDYFPFRFYIKSIFQEEIFLFLPSFMIVIIVYWLLKEV